MPSPYFVSLFSGCGGLDLGFVNEGFRPVAAYDNWDDAISCYRRNLGDHIHKADLRDGLPLLPAKAANVDVVLAGSPCQGFSTAGRRNIDDPRNSLLESAVRISLQLKPKVIVLENVPGVLYGSHKNYMDGVCSLLREAGYRTETIRLNAESLGVAQKRKRVFVLAWKSGASPTFDIQAKAIKTVEQALQNCADLPNHLPNALVTRSDDYRISQKIGPGQKLCDIRRGKGAVHTWDIPEVFGRTTAKERLLLDALIRLRRTERERDHGEGDPVTIARLVKACAFDVTEPVRILMQKGYLRKIERKIDLKFTFNGKYRRLDPTGTANTVDSYFGDPRYVLHPTEHRGMTLREAARIQSFPDTFVFDEPSRNQFRLIGNAVPPLMARTVASIVRDRLLS